MSNSLSLIGFASGVAANNPDCALGPWYLYYHPEILQRIAMTPVWHSMIKTTTMLTGVSALPLVEKNLIALSEAILPLALAKTPFCVIGGDHSCAIGTWSAVAHANRHQGDIGMIWIDAHMDAHTPSSSLTQNIHGMPIAHLLGHGVANLCQILDAKPKLKPQNLCLIGIRSFEEEEKILLESLGVQIFYMDDIERLGIDLVMEQAYQHVTANTCGFGLSIDLDAIDPQDAPAVGYRVPGGIPGKALLHTLKRMPHKQKLLGLEITEFNPMLDENAKTAELIVDLIRAVYE